VNALQKCFLVSTGCHLAAFGALLSSPFFHWKTTVAAADSNLPLVQLVDSLPQADTSKDFKVTQSAATPEAKPSAASVTPPNLEPPRLPKVSTRLVKRSDVEMASTRDGKLEVEFTRKVNRIFGNLAAATKVELGTASETVTGPDNYADIVRFFYAQSWQPPEDGRAGEGVFAKVAVTIGRDGEVIDASILKGSGNAELDESVRRALGRVTSIEPFAPGVKDDKRTYTLNFSVHMVGG
jgi:TonB family protein